MQTVYVKDSVSAGIKKRHYGMALFGILTRRLYKSSALKNEQWKLSTNHTKMKLQGTMNFKNDTIYIRTTVSVLRNVSGKSWLASLQHTLRQTRTHKQALRDPQVLSGMKSPQIDPQTLTACAADGARGTRQ